MKEIMSLYSPKKTEQESGEYNYEQQRKLVESFLARIDVDALVDVYADLKRKSLGWERGGSDDYVFHVYMRHVLKDPDIEEGVRGGQVAAIQPMLADDVVFAKLKVFVKGLDAGGERDFSKFLKAVMHELAHAASLANRLQDGQVMAGFQKASIEERQFTPLNEAFTEYVADAVYSEYLRRTGNQKDATVFSYGPMSIKYDREQYGVYRRFLEVLIDKISQESGFEREEIVKSMLGHYMRPDFSQELDEIYSVVSLEIQQEFEMLKIDPLGFGNQITHPADSESRFVPKLKLICQELLQKKEGRQHVEAIFGKDIFAGKRFVAR